jgi:hypothetical protein
MEFGGSDERLVILGVGSCETSPRTTNYRRRKVSTADNSAARVPGSKAECPASGTTVSRAAGQAAARSKALIGGHTMS